MSKHLPFATFADNYFRDKKYDQMPSIIEDVQPLLFKDEINKKILKRI